MASEVMRAADGTPLRTKLRQAERREVLRSFGLIAPLFLFIGISFLVAFWRRPTLLELNASVS